MRNKRILTQPPQRDAALVVTNRDPVMHDWIAYVVEGHRRAALSNAAARPRA